MVTLLGGYAGPIDREDLKRENFSDAEIDRLSRLRDAYPHVEFSETSREWRRMEFLRWRYRKGTLTEWPD